MKQQIIFVVGSDRTGKTQIAKALAKELSLPYFKAESEHRSYKLSSGLFVPDDVPENANKAFEWVVKNPFFMELQYADPRSLDLFRQGGFSMVFDRNFPCEKVYSKVFGRVTNEKMLDHLDEEWAKLGARIIITTRSSYEGIVDDIDPRIDSKRLQQLDDAYKEFSQETKCKYLLLNVDDENLNRELTDILNWIDVTRK